MQLLPRRQRRRPALLRILLRHWSGELAAVDEFEFAGLFRHGGCDLGHAMPNQIDGGGARQIHVLLARAIPNVYAFCANSYREFSSE